MSSPPRSWFDRPGTWELCATEDALGFFVNPDAGKPELRAYVLRVLAKLVEHSDKAADVFTRVTHAVALPPGWTLEVRELRVRDVERPELGVARVLLERCVDVSARSSEHYTSLLRM